MLLMLLMSLVLHGSSGSGGDCTPPSGATFSMIWRDISVPALGADLPLLFDIAVSSSRDSSGDILAKNRKETWKKCFYFFKCFYHHQKHCEDDKFLIWKFLFIITYCFVHDNLSLFFSLILRALMSTRYQPNFFYGKMKKNIVGYNETYKSWLLFYLQGVSAKLVHLKLKNFRVCVS